MDPRVMELRIKKWIPVIEEQAKSGMSKKEWCAKNERISTEAHIQFSELNGKYTAIVRENEELKKLLEENVLFERKLESYANQLDVLMQSEEKISALRHDMKHHLNELLIMAKRNEDHNHEITDTAHRTGNCGREGKNVRQI